MSLQEALEKIRKKSDEIIRFIDNIKSELNDCQEQLALAQCQNKELEIKAKTLSKAIIEQQEHYTSLLKRRQFLLFEGGLVDVKGHSEDTLNAKTVQQLSSQNSTSSLEPYKFDAGSSFHQSEVSLEIAKCKEIFRNTYQVKYKEMQKSAPKDVGNFLIAHDYKSAQFKSKGFLVLTTYNNVIALADLEQIVQMDLDDHSWLRLPAINTVSMDIIQKNEVFVGFNSGNVESIDFAQNEKQLIFTHCGSVLAVKVHPNRKYGISMSALGWALQDLERKTLIRFQEMNHAMQSLDIHPSGAYLATSVEGKIILWDILKEMPMRELEGIDALYLKFLPYGNQICSGERNTVRIINALTYPAETISAKIFESDTFCWCMHHAGMFVASSFGDNILFHSIPKQVGGQAISSEGKLNIGTPILSISFSTKYLIVLTNEGFKLFTY